MTKEEEKKEKHREYMRKYQKKWRKNNPRYLAYRREWMRNWWKNNPEKGRKRSAENYRKHKEKRLAQIKEYRQRPEVKERERLRSKRRRKTEKIKMYHREYRKTEKYRKYNRERWAKLSQDSNERLGTYLRTRIRHALKVKTPKSARTQELIGITVPKLKKYLEKQFRDGMSWDNYGKWHIDHIRPLATFDLTKPEEQKKAFHYMNLQPLWAEENLRKSKKYLD